jgi:hypothetical protein
MIADFMVRRVIARSRMVVWILANSAAWLEWQLIDYPLNNRLKTTAFYQRVTAKYH